MEYPKNIGLNNGVMLMDVEKILKTSFIEECNEIGANETLYFQLADQDIMNIYFKIHPERVFFLPYWCVMHKNSMSIQLQQ